MEAKGLYHAVLYVKDLAESRAFYEMIGFKPLPMPNANFKAAAFVGADHRTHHELLLIEVGDAPKAPARRLGLYHLGIKVGDSKAELRAAYDELLAANVTIDGMSDHTATWSLYIRDPDGNELELYADNPEVDWKHNPEAIMAPIKHLKWE